jgi:hypothetical protein
MIPIFARRFSVVSAESSVKFDTVHENETGYIVVLASVDMNAHDATETGFCFAISRIKQAVKSFRRNECQSGCAGSTLSHAVYHFNQQKATLS